MWKKKKGMQNMNDVTKEEGVNELSDESLENANGGIVYRRHGVYVVEWRDKYGKLQKLETPDRGFAIRFDKIHHGSGEVV